MSIPRTTRGIARIPGVSIFRSAYQPPSPQLREASLYPCSGCGKAFSFPPDTPWDEVMQNVAEHVRLCERVVEKGEQRKKNSRKATKRAKKGPKVRKTENAAEEAKERQTVLEEDPWTAFVEPTQVRCAACGVLIQLDKRRDFYPGLWRNHKDRCPGIDQVFGRAERLLSPVIRMFFGRQENPPGREFLNLTRVPTRERRRQQKKREEARRRRERRAKAKDMERNYHPKDVERYGSGMHRATCTPNGRNRSQGDREPLGVVNSNYGIRETPLVPGPPTTSLSLNAILCPVTVGEIENRHRQLARIGASRERSSHHSCGEFQPEFIKNRKRYCPYSKPRLSVPRRGSQDCGIGTYPNDPLAGNQFNSNSARGCYSFKRQNLVGGESCGYGEQGGQSAYGSCSLPATPSLQPGDLTSDNETCTSRAPSPWAGGTEGGIWCYQKQSSEYGHQTLDETCLESPHYYPSPSSTSSTSPIINISTLCHRTVFSCSPSHAREQAHPSWNGSDFLSYPPEGWSNDYQHSCYGSELGITACYSARYPMLVNGFSTSVPKLRPLTEEDFGRSDGGRSYDADYSGEEDECVV